MGQKINPNIFQINKTNEWNSRYIEKKSKDFYLHTIKDLEVKKFIYKFFQNHGLDVHNCKLNYSTNNLNMYISYQQNHNSTYLINEINKNQKIKLIKNYSKKLNNKNNNSIIKVIKNYHNYKNLILKKYFLKKKINNASISQIQRLKIIKYYKKYLILKKNKQIKNSLSNNFFNKFFKSLTLFYNKLVTVNLIIQPVNTSLMTILNKKKQDTIKKKLIKLKKYQKNNFFKEGVNMIFSLINKYNSAFLLSNFLSLNLKKLKYHNFFLKFIRTALTIFISDKSISSKIKGIKLNFKGRLNKAPRAKSKMIIIGNVPVFTINSKIDYSETTAYTSNGTLGVKVWLCYY